MIADWVADVWLGFVLAVLVRAGVELWRRQRARKGVAMPAAGLMPGPDEIDWTGWPDVAPPR
jgi:hypothetical protein